VTRSAIASLIDGDETTIGGVLEGDLSIITHADGMAILDEYFPKSVGAAAPDGLTTSIADAACRDSPFVPLIQSHALEATALSSAGPNAFSLEASGILDPDQATGGFKSTSNTGSPKSYRLEEQSVS
jgi:hypothetical protein